MLKAHLEQLVFKLLQNEHTCLKDGLPAVNDKVIPDAKKFPHVLVRLLQLHDLSEESYEVTRAVVAAIYTFLFHMPVQVWQNDGDEAIKAIEVQL